MKRYYLLTLLVISFVGLPNPNRQSSQILIGGTAISTIMTTDSIWIAADSKAAITHRPKNLKFIPDLKHLPKIIIVDNTAAAFSGTMVIDYTPEGNLLFSMPDEMKKAIRDIPSFIPLVSSFAKAIKEKMELLIRDIQRTDPAEFEQLLKIGNLAQCLVGTFNNWGPNENTIEFVLLGDKFHWRVEAHTTVLLPAPRVNFMGESQDAKLYLSQHLELGGSSIPRYEVLRKLISVEIEKKPDLVGGDINILVLYQGGFRWYPPMKQY